MWIEVKGTDKVLEDLEEAKEMIRKAEEILHRTTFKFSLELMPDTGTELLTDSVQDNQ